MRTPIRVNDYPQPNRWQEEQPAIEGVIPEIKCEYDLVAGN
jgi:hypothetical protein